MYTVWHVNKYKITFKLFINCTNEILQHIVVSSGLSRPGIIDARARYRAAARRLRNTGLDGVHPRRQRFSSLIKTPQASCKGQHWVLRYNQYYYTRTCASHSRTANVATHQLCFYEFSHKIYSQRITQFVITLPLHLQQPCCDVNICQFVNLTISYIKSLDHWHFVVSVSLDMFNGSRILQLYVYVMFCIDLIQSKQFIYFSANKHFTYLASC